MPSNPPTSGLAALRRRLERWNGSTVQYDLSAYARQLGDIERRETALRDLPDSRLASLGEEIRASIRSGQEAADVRGEAFALVREVSRRVLGMRPFDVQVVAAIAMSEGKLVEMATGEGKTLAAVMPAWLAALEGRGVHVLTFNDYLARRDAEWMGPVYRFLGSSVGWVRDGLDCDARRAAYGSDVTYVTAKEAGFDLLRSHLVQSREDDVHRPFHFAIVDEADSILIDEARVPLVIAGAMGTTSTPHERLVELVRSLDPATDYEVDENARNVRLTGVGIDRSEAFLGCGDLMSDDRLDLFTELNCALHAHVLLHRDVDYIVRDDRILVVDEFTGRVVEDRHWPDGLQAALEAKEAVRRRPEGRILSSITLQHFVRLYPRVAGMTATARPAAEEMRRYYGLDVVVVPPNRLSRRVDHPDVVFTHREAKHLALVDEIRAVHARDRPILVGTASVEESEELHRLLRAAGVESEVLNARNDEREAAIISQAGAPGAVTISTNMAGRGTDIRLGGADESERDRVVALGGLYVIGTNRHESRRIDDQLRGRAGRQGDPGSSRFFISLEDPLIVRYGVRRLIPPRHLPGPRDEPLDNPVIRREIARAQRIVEGQNAEIGKTLFDYSSLVEEQRKKVHARRVALLGDSPPERLRELAPERYGELLPQVGVEVLRDVERTISRFQHDRCWERHLARVADLREGIHLLRVGGRDPLSEFLRLAADSFERMNAEIDEALARTFRAATITRDGIDLSKEGLRGPSSTWTYLVNDDPFRDQLSLALGGNVAFGAAAALYTGPLLIAWGLYNRFFRKRPGSDTTDGAGPAS